MTENIATCLRLFNAADSWRACISSSAIFTAALRASASLRVGSQAFQQQPRPGENIPGIRSNSSA